MTPEFVDENDLATTVSSYRLENPTDITRAQYDELNETQSFFQDDAFVESASAPGFDVLGVDGVTEVGSPRSRIRRLRSRGCSSNWPSPSDH